MVVGPPRDHQMTWWHVASQSQSSLARRALQGAPRADGYTGTRIDACASEWVMQDAYHFQNTRTARTVIPVAPDAGRAATELTR